MGKIVAYIRPSTYLRHEDSQREVLLAYTDLMQITIDDFIEIPVANRKSSRQSRSKELMARLEPGDTLLVAEIGQLGRSTGEVITLLNRLIAERITVTIIKENLRFDGELRDIAAKVVAHLLARFSELEQDFVSLRTKEALAAKKAEGVTLGKPRGTIQASIYDNDRDRIQVLLDLGVSQRRISKTHLGYGTSTSLGHYIRTRGLRKEPEQAAM